MARRNSSTTLAEILAACSRLAFRCLVLRRVMCDKFTPPDVRHSATT